MDCDIIVVERSPKGRFIRDKEELGCGAQKKVYKAYDLERGSEVAWNAVNLYAISEKRRKLLTEEITLIKMLDHPNILKCRGAWVASGQCIFITDLCTGGSLKSYMKKIRSPRRRVIKNWCKGILEGLSYLHTQNPPIVHRDIKCENIFLDSTTGNVKIGDLGLSTALSTSQRSFKGTPSFMAPEMYEDRYGPGVDIYSFGMCVLEMCTMQNPYSECQNAAELFKKVMSHKSPEALHRIKDSQIVEFIKQCLLPADSRPTAEELLRSDFLNSESKIDREPVLVDNSVVLQSVAISMSLANYLQGPQAITFEYFFSKDTPEGIALEMIQEFQIRKSFLPMLTAQITHLIDSKVRTVPGLRSQQEVKLIEI
ncbi:unnamed protein product [Blepharisma stoltei]|uniref:Protein kinase domain-containing protein n=1 Tax=Blepharisma stoltei TaxID=1481888 RepID=A0AAU9K6X3_9CILI|nr:unnamed protein product [Blepharisma stoltei]